MAYAYDASLLDRIKPRISQWEATTGRRISPSMLDALIKGQLDAEAGKATQERALDLQERGLADAKDAANKASKAATTKGYVDTASTAGMGYLTYKAVTKPSAMSELIAYQKSIGATPAITGADITAAGGSFGAPTAEAAGYGLTAPGYTAPAFTGAQTTLAGGTTATGAQLIPEAGGFSGAGIGDFAVEAGAGEGLGSAGAASGFASLAPYAGPAAAGFAGGKLLGPTLDKVLPGGGKPGKAVGGAAGGALAGAAVGSVVPGVGTAIGAVVGGIIGGVSSLIEDSVICSELVRQKRISERERTACVVFRFRYIPDDMFMAYLEWAEPIVRLMRNNRAANFFLVPFAMHFVGYMLAVQAKVEPTITERLVWKYAWWRCEKIARLAGQSVKEVAA